MKDRKTLRISVSSVFAVLLMVFIIPFGESGRIIAAVLLLPSTVLMYGIIKKRPILSMYKGQVLLIITTMAAVYLMLYYLSGSYFGFYKSIYKLNLSTILKFILPIAAIIVTTEIIRFIVVSQGDKTSTILCYFSCVISDMLICASVSEISSFNDFMDLIAGAVFPALIFNLLYNYLSKRYGIYPGLVFRLATSLNIFIIPYESAIADSLLNFIRLILPIGIYLFIDSLYEKKRRYALGNRSRVGRFASRVLTGVVVFIMLGTIMLVSNQFKFGSYVIATESMTGEINKGDVVIYERYDDQIITTGQVIAFEKDKSVVIHRVVDIQVINGNIRYYTKGDANEDMDAGYVTRGEIIGLINYKLPFFGYPTIWVRSIFKR